MQPAPRQDSRPVRNLFGCVRMGYALIESNRLDDWRKFGAEALGLHMDQPQKDVLAFRIDQHQRRLIVRQGGAEDFAALGWQLDNKEVLAEVLARLHARGVKTEQGTPEEAGLRGVESFVRFMGPKRQPIEVFTRAFTTDKPLSIKPSGFVTGAAGMGHVAITSKSAEDTVNFWMQIFDARLSDTIEAHISGLTLDITFLRLNERHHSVAIAATRGVRMNPIRTLVQHMNLQVASLEDMTATYQRCRQLGYRIAMGVGQHTNDRELSFYVYSPSGFQIEVGWGPIAVEESAWQTAKHQGISTWGHKPQDQTVADKVGELVCSVRSLANTEFQPI